MYQRVHISEQSRVLTEIKYHKDKEKLSPLNVS